MASCDDDDDDGDCDDGGDPGGGVYASEGPPANGCYVETCVTISRCVETAGREICTETESCTIYLIC